MLHPSKDIMFTKSRMLEGKKIALCICGSVAAIKAPDLARELMRNGAEVFAIMSPSAQKLISPTLLEWATGNPVITELTGKIEHVQLGGKGGVDLILIAPATANTIGKIAAGIDDTPVTSLATTAIGSGIPVMIAPVMHGSMYRHPLVSENLKKLSSLGIKIIPPEIVEDKAKFPDISVIVEEVLSALSRKDMTGISVLVTAGPTRSYMDSIRFLTNSSSGKMGYAFAYEASARGARVTLISGPTNLANPRGANIVPVGTTEEMLEAVDNALSKEKYDLFVMAAAPLDFAIVEKFDGKVPSTSELKLTLRPLPKIVDVARKKSKDLFIIGFKAEYNLTREELFSRAMSRLLESGMDLIVANDLSSPLTGFKADTDEVYILDKSGLVDHIPLSPKREVARRVLDLYLKRRGSNAVTSSHSS
ncbi:MAG: bifunctional phosphopantothenoylcysteine decarboxylase/phosphopantothenate--cysteine ligase CoaBC [Candidatus Verstraetearchaeota archaeon]|uniref:Coenzyme A biosynthesis bifunctional protein CoaBC n=1 Tax=Thermoproteota archaeon TaxID=2056631 RepID=A0A523BG28_9CREN|nr:bifunctional phosphopantothenoylcysteine decarboxylase/phosphopantothenate--cysteine ligase CoaBC [Candidatus Verstraetearchaeota archaeon]TDA39897.1 MAG: bifunctional phosphopantothenoylcysteine decarboxylase/phosphopantothenate--cysteine ligase CoaBC [Candidatus Verstraetearchaeota archaeon]